MKQYEKLVYCSPYHTQPLPQCSTKLKTELPCNQILLCSWLGFRYQTRLEVFIENIERRHKILIEDRFYRSSSVHLNLIFTLTDHFGCLHHKFNHWVFILSVTFLSLVQPFHNPFKSIGILENLDIFENIRS